MMKRLRQISQLISLLIFIGLFLHTGYRGSDALSLHCGIFLYLDPLVFLSTLLGCRTVFLPLLYSLLILIPTLFLGRFFCGWLCPMGTIIDLVDCALPSSRTKSSPNQRLKNIKYYLLAFIAISSLFTLQSIYLLDPLIILTRSLTFSLYPAATYIINSIFELIYRTKVAPLVDLTVYIEQFLRVSILGLEQPHFRTSLLPLFLFLVVIGLGLLTPRFWCRNICPLGGLYGLASSYATFRRETSKAHCRGCSACRTICKMGVSHPEDGFNSRECILCLSCLAHCKNDAIGFRFKVAKEQATYNLSRRYFLTSVIGGALIAPILKISTARRANNQRLIRPPGAKTEGKFLTQCTRCGACMKVCTTNGLQPTLLEAGLEGLWTPTLVPRIGYCEYNCTLCGQVCPTSAIKSLSIEEKKVWKIGIAYIDENRCIPFSMKTECLVCEEFCPIPEKAIVFRKVGGIRRPFVMEPLCIGCGACEAKCPLPDPAIVVINRDHKSQVNLPFY